MKNSYTAIHYNEEIRPYSNYSWLLCKHLIKKYFGSAEGKLLDVGCGRGEHVDIFNKLGVDTYGVDLEAGAKKTKRVDLETEKIPFPDNHFDYIMCKSVIEHIRNVYHLMAEMHRVLKPGGKIVIMTADWPSNMANFYCDVDHKTPFMKCSLRDLLLRYDFRKVNVDFFFCLPYTWKSKLLHIFPLIVRNIFRIDFEPTVKLNLLVKQLKFSREKQIIGYGEK
jgi:ubiquinone/menaquinone biosynthesis C-methylase UbiE